MSVTLISPSIVVNVAPTCRHHWLIELAHGAVSRGICKRCHAIRRFHNAVDDLPGRERGRFAASALRRAS